MRSIDDNKEVHSLDLPSLSQFQGHECNYWNIAIVSIESMRDDYM